MQAQAPLLEPRVNAFPRPFRIRLHAHFSGGMCNKRVDDHSYFPGRATIILLMSKLSKSSRLAFSLAGIF